MQSRAPTTETRLSARLVHVSCAARRRSPLLPPALCPGGYFHGPLGLLARRHPSCSGGHFRGPPAPSDQRPVSCPGGHVRGLQFPSLCGLLLILEVTSMDLQLLLIGSYLSVLEATSSGLQSCLLDIQLPFPGPPSAGLRFLLPGRPAFAPSSSTFFAFPCWIFSSLVSVAISAICLSCLVVF